MASYKIINMKKIQYSKRHKFSRTSSVADNDTDFDFAGKDKRYVVGIFSTHLNLIEFTY